MVERQLRARRIRDERVLDAMGRIARERFLDPGQQGEAYDDGPLQIGHGQTISQPYMTALMAEALGLTGTEKVLEVGTGCGYHAAVLGALAREVISLELVPELAARAAVNLVAWANVRVVAGDGSRGYPEKAPYDAISVAAGAPAVPEELTGQLAEGGRMVIPVGDRTEQTLLVLTREGDRLRRRSAGGCRFVLLRGGAGWR